MLSCLIFVCNPTFSFRFILFRLPFTDQTASKQRPAAVVSSAAYHRNHPDLIIMALTSQVRSVTIVGERPVIFCKEAGLLKPSMIKPVLATVEKRLILRKLGQFRKFCTWSLMCETKKTESTCPEAP